MRNSFIRHLFVVSGLLFSINAFAATPQELLKQYEIQGKQENAAFAGFSAERGAIFFKTERIHSDGKKVSCSTCHTSDPRKQGKTRANKVIEPMATIVNPERFTDAAKVEKWFGRNCKDVLERVCTSQEKGDYIQYLISVK
jgi:cytochrome c peroxidase